MEMKEEEVVIIGGGIAGLATALALKKVGIQALVLEGSTELRITGAALMLFSNAWSALDALGIAHKLTSIYAPYHGGRVTKVPSGDTQEVMIQGNPRRAGPRAVHRRTLLELLAAELPKETIRFSSKLKYIKTSAQHGSTYTILGLEDGTVFKAKVVIGCDGVHSVVSRWLGLSDPVNSGRLAVRGISVFPQGHGLKHEVHQFVGHGHRFGIAPINDREIYWFVAYKSTPKKEEEMMKGDPNLIQETMLEYLEDFPRVVLDVIKHSDTRTLTCSPLMFRVPWELIFRVLCKENITVAGDAMHPMTPDLGQGGCSALEDAVVLGRHIGNSFLRHGQIVPEDVAGALDNYVKERRWRAAGLILGSYMAGRVQQGESGWLAKFLRDTVFYKAILRRLTDLLHYDCGDLPSVSTRVESEAETNIKKFD